MDLRCYVLALSADQPKAGLAVADFDVTIHKVEKATKTLTTVVTAADMQKELGNGYYAYYYHAPDYVTYDYFAEVKYTGSVLLDHTFWQGSFTQEILGRGYITYL